MFAGSRQFQLSADPGGSPLGALVHYPAAERSAPTWFGPYELDVSVDAPLAPGRFPLVLISHGSGGSPLLYRTVSLALARSGYIVALPKHPGNSLGDDALANTAENLRNRPRQLLRLMEALQNAGHFSFLSPFPRQVREPQFAPGQDPSGFDRRRFHQQLPITILEWLRERRREHRAGAGTTS